MSSRKLWSMLISQLLSPLQTASPCVQEDSMSQPDPHKIQPSAITFYPPHHCLHITHMPLQFFPQNFCTPPISHKTLFYIPNMYRPLQSTFTLFTPILFACPIIFTGPLENFSAIHLEKAIFCQPQRSSQQPPHQYIYIKSLSWCARSKTLLLLWKLLQNKPIFLAKPLEEASHLDQAPGNIAVIF
jgi:hypothetical protein